MGEFYVEGSGLGYVAAGQPDSVSVEIDFKDGRHSVPGPIVAHLGGAEVLLSKQGLFKEHTHQEFIDGFFRLVSESGVKAALGAVIRDHLSLYGLRQ